MAADILESSSSWKESKISTNCLHLSLIHCDTLGGEISLMSIAYYSKPLYVTGQSVFTESIKASTRIMITM